MLPLPFTLVIFLCVGVVVAIALGEQKAREVWTSSATMTLLATGFVMFLAAPSWYVAIRYPDWYVSYLFDASALPSAARALMASTASITAVLGFALGVSLLSARRMDRLAMLVLGCTVALMVVFGIAGPRLAIVGSTVQFTSRVGTLRFLDSGLGRAVFFGSLSQIVGLAYLVRAAKAQSDMTALR